jgi:hypothetical protein
MSVKPRLVIRFIPAPFGLTFALETHADQIDQMTGAAARS